MLKPLQLLAYVSEGHVAKAITLEWNLHQKFSQAKAKKLFMVLYSHESCETVENSEKAIVPEKRYI